MGCPVMVGMDKGHSELDLVQSQLGTELFSFFFVRNSLGTLVETVYKLGLPERDVGLTWSDFTYRKVWMLSWSDI